MNTRLQVEHPVTELVTGIDLVQSQIRIAANEKLPLIQADVQFRGHAIECRIYAEDPGNQFFPSPGKITLMREPSGPGVRLDTGVYEGWMVPADYDPLLAKLTAYGEGRDQAISRSLRAIDEMFVGGIQTNLSLFRQILSDADFRAGNIDTGYLDRLLTSDASSEHPEPAQVAAIAAVLFNVVENKKQSVGTANNGASLSDSNWKRAARIESSNMET
jgi:acetyl-CoA carboxylase, biotin carboxylase subunit